MRARIHQKRSKQVKHPFKAVDQSHAQADHRAAHHQRAKDAPEQHTVLVTRLDSEVFEQQDEDEDVVHAERFFNQIAREEFQRRGPPVPVQQP